MDQYEFIRTAVRLHGKRIREVARLFKYSRKTIRKALAGVTPGYRMEKPRAMPVMARVRAVVDQWLLEDQERPPKQRHTGKRIYDRLKAEYGFEGGESTVRHYVGNQKRRMKEASREAMIPLCQVPEGEAEVDWAEAMVKIGGEDLKVKLFMMRSRYSGKPFVRAYRREAQEMLLDAHQHAFVYFGGVFPVIVYDNLKTAVARVLKGKKRDEQNAFRMFRAHYTYEARFCNPARGNEKGGVEGCIRDFRRNRMVPLPEAESLEELNAQLLEDCANWSERTLGNREGRRTIDEYFEEERGKLMSLPKTPLVIGRVTSGRVDKYQTVRLEGVRYSVPTEYVGSRVEICLGCEEVVISWGGQIIARHRRRFDETWALSPLHYLGLLRRKPGALERARPLAEWRESWPSSHEHLLRRWQERHGRDDGNREFVVALNLYLHYAAEDVETAFALAVEHGVSDSQSLKALVHNLREREEAPLCESKLPERCRTWHQPPDLSKYDRLMVTP